MKELTARQKTVLNFIRSYFKDHKYPPTIREIAEHFKISVKGGYDHLRALKNKGYIRSSSSRSRALEILGTYDQKSEYEVTEIPIIGKVVAGSPILSEENYIGKIGMPQSFLGSGVFFALKIEGDSMIDAGILNGDIGIIRQQSVAENGEIVVARVDDDRVTLKYLHIEKNRVRLQPANTAYNAIYTKNVTVEGKLFYLIRNYAK